MEEDAYDQHNRFIAGPFADTIERKEEIKHDESSPDIICGSSSAKRIRHIAFSLQKKARFVFCCFEFVFGRLV